MNMNHPYHLVDKSPWPIMMSLSLMIIMVGMIFSFKVYEFNLFYMGFFLILIVSFQWWRDVVRESTFQGNHTNKVMSGLKFGMVIFILSELLFFFSFFWCFFHSSLSPSIELGLIWPPLGIFSFNPLNIPLLNTIILLSSGFSLTLAHYSLLTGNLSSCKNSVFLTLFLGVYFSLLQLYEYTESSFSISDSVYGSIFFLSTGFHGIHVIIGSFFILVCLVRLMSYHFCMSHHLGFEFSAWYWHFVDVVWLFLYISVYWWGGNV